MNWYRTLCGQFLALTLLLGACLLAGNGLVFYNSHLVAAGSDTLAGSSLPLVDRAHQMKLAVVQVQQWLTDISATRGRDGLDDGYDQAAANAERFRKALAEIDALAPQLEVRRSDILASFEAYYAAGRKMAEAYVAGGPEAGNRLMGEFDATAEHLADRVDALLARIQKEAADVAVREKALAHLADIELLVVSLVMLGLLFGFYRFFSRRLKALGGMMPIVQAIGEGDLGQAVVVDSHDEIGRIAAALETMRQSLAAIMRRIGDGSRVLREGAQMLDTAVTVAGENAERHRLTTDELATTVEQMAAAAGEIAAHIGEVAEAGREAREQTANGRHSLDGATARLGELVDQIRGTRDVIDLLAQHSDAITGILDVIRGIAEQTNLLALNAAIEAARAGEQGRGFAVVADEVRTLASRTQASTEEIQEMIEKLVGGVNQAVTSMDQSADLADATMREATGAASAFASIVELVDHVSSNSAHIASAAEQQSAVSRQIAEHVQGIRERAEDTARNMQEAKAGVSRVAGQAMDLDALVGRFKP